MNILIDVVSRNISILSNYFANNYKHFYYTLFDNDFNYYEFTIVTLVSFLLFGIIGLSLYVIYIIYNFTSFNLNSKPKNITNKNIKLFKKEGLYLESLTELVDKKIPKDNEISRYQILLRIKLNKDINLPKTKYDLHGNNITGDPNVDTTFKTKDLFMIVNLHFNENNYLHHNIVNLMNTINNIMPQFLKNEDFIIIMISKNNILMKDFIQGLKNNNYSNHHLFKYMIQQIKTQNYINNVIPSFKLCFTLPIHNVYDIFADTFNNVIFESKYYEMDDNNYESWKKKSINEIKSF